MLNLLWNMTRPLLFTMDAEKAHRLTLESMERFPRVSRTLLTSRPPASLATTIAGLRLASPIGLAAGMDKDGEATTVWPSIGFGFIELGTVTAHPQSGNPKPRLFRLKAEQGIINRMGFNNQGSEALAQKLTALRQQDKWPAIPVGSNIGKSKITPIEDATEDYLISVRRLRDVTDYFTVNVSSPNTPGLRQLQEANKLKALLGAILTERKDKPVFVKFSPDMEEKALEASIKVVIEVGCDGIIATNTTNSRPNTTDRLGEKGGLSGDPLWGLARSRIQNIVDIVAGDLPVIGVGGVNSPERAKELLTIGCKAVQIYSALVYKGPRLIAQINRSLAG